MVKKYLLPPSIFHSIVLLIRSVRSGDPTTACLPTHDSVYLFISQGERAASRDITESKDLTVRLSILTKPH